MSGTSFIPKQQNSILEYSPDCIILAAGRSARFNHFHKALLPFSEKENFLEHLIRLYRDWGINKIQVITHPEISIPESLKLLPGVTFTINELTDRGRLYSIQCGLNEIPNSSFCFVQNIDSPFVLPDELHQLTKERMNGDYITPEYNSKGGHPILLNGKVMEHIRALTNCDLSLQEVLKKFRRKKITVNNPLVLVNINTPEEYFHYFPSESAPVQLREHTQAIHPKFQNP